MIINEKIAHEHPLLSLRVFRLRRRHNIMNHWHYHKEAEILLVLEGWLEVHVDDEMYRLESGDLLVIGSHQLHRDRTSRESGLHYIVLQFDPEPYFAASILPYLKFFSQTRLPLSRMNEILAHNLEAKKCIYETVLDIHREMNEKKPGYEIAVNMLINRVILTLFRADTKQYMQTEMHPDLMRLNPVIDWIEHNTSDKLSVEKACTLANMSYYYFVKYFKKVMGMTFTDYVHYKKIKKAERILLTENISVSAVGEKIGMPNMAHFYKVFKKFNACSPNEFRQAMQRWTS